MELRNKEVYRGLKSLIYFVVLHDYSVIVLCIGIVKLSMLEYS